MKKLALTGLAGLFVLSAAFAAFAQSSTNGVVGVMSPSGAFQPLPDRAPVNSGATPTTVSGEFKLQLTVSVLSGIPLSTPVHCTLQASVVAVATVPPLGTVDSITDSSVTTATRSGSQATCNVVLPYKWKLFGSGDMVTLGYLVNATSSAGVGRTISVFFDTIPVPPNGTITKETQSGAI